MLEIKLKIEGKTRTFKQKEVSARSMRNMLKFYDKMEKSESGENKLTELESLTVNGTEATKLNRDTYKFASTDIGESSKVIATSVYPNAEVQVNTLGADVHVTQKVVSTLENETIVKI